MEYLNAVSGLDTSIIDMEYARLTQHALEMMMAQT